MKTKAKRDGDTPLPAVVALPLELLEGDEAAAEGVLLWSVAVLEPLSPPLRASSTMS